MRRCSRVLCVVAWSLKNFWQVVTLGFPDEFGGSWWFGEVTEGDFYIWGCVTFVLKVPVQCRLDVLGWLGFGNLDLVEVSWWSYFAGEHVVV